MTSETIRHYVNPPHDLQQMLHSALARNSQLSGRNIAVGFDGSQITLRGVVRTYYQKQMALQSIQPLVGDQRIRNEIEVVGNSPLEGN